MKRLSVILPNYEHFNITVAHVREILRTSDIRPYEIVVVNDFKGTSYIFIYSYSRGIIQELFAKEILNNKIVIKQEYIEYNNPDGEDLLWNYYQGQFWEMKPYKNDGFSDI